MLTPSVTTRRVDGGLLVSGRWAYASGCLHSDWAVLGLPVVNEQGTQIDEGIALIPLRDLAIEDTWFVAGMRGTGSNTLVAEDVFVPDHRIMSGPRAVQGDYPTEHKNEALYRSAFVPMLAVVLAAPQLGMARAALQYVIEKAPRRPVMYTAFQRQIDSTAFQMAVGDAAMMIETAHLHVYRAAADIGGAAARGEKLDCHARESPGRHGLGDPQGARGHRPARLRARIGELRRVEPAPADLARLEHRGTARGRPSPRQPGALRQGAARHRGQHHTIDLMLSFAERWAMEYSHR